MYVHVHVLFPERQGKQVRQSPKADSEKNMYVHVHTCTNVLTPTCTCKFSHTDKATTPFFSR